MANPDVDVLQTSGKYELVKELDHSQVKEFVLHQIDTRSKLIRGYMIYQLVMLLIGLFYVTYPLVLAFHSNFQPLIYLICSIVFTFTLLILIHELLHVLALKLTGADKVSIGKIPGKFIFYAEADRHVLNRKQFTGVALTPFLAVKLITLAAILMSADHPSHFFWIFVMCAHSLFCAGDVALLAFFYKNRHAEIFTFDVSNEKKSYFYQEK